LDPTDSHEIIDRGFNYELDMFRGR
jgi:hypothetical protein